MASLPCYSAANVDAQRGRGVFDRSIRGLQLLNAAGYGVEGSGLKLDLVYNPGGAFLAPPQADLEPAYKTELLEAFGIRFTSLLALNNMPIKRFADFLVREGKLTEYMEARSGGMGKERRGEAGGAMRQGSHRPSLLIPACPTLVAHIPSPAPQLLVNAFNPASVQGVMCTDTVSVGWDGRLYDCDFNGQLDIGAGKGGRASVFDVESLADLAGPVAVGSHCFGCTAGQGSGCQGATAGG